jgi:hypothetical protein
MNDTNAQTQTIFSKSVHASYSANLSMCLRDFHMQGIVLGPNYVTSSVVACY